ncbi:MAG: molybdopterin molybdotransferase MoeA [Acidianus infernus]|nr:molybdopterin molybdotransferase MoeA [Acidianus infernus]
MMLIPLEEARKIIEETEFPKPSVREVDLLDSVGKIVAEDIISIEDIPERDLSAMDGYAIRSEDFGKKLKVVGSLFPSSKEVPKINEGEAFYVTTGAPIPEGADAVCRVEATKREGDYVIIGEKVHKGKDIRPKGEDIKKGEKILNKGEKITPYHLGILAYEKIYKIKVLNISFAVFANGDELSPFHSNGEKVDSITPILIPLLSSFGNVTYLGVAKDNPDDIEKFIEKASSFDFIISIGGSSVGEKDYVKRVIEKKGGKLLFEGVSVNVLKRGSVGLINGKPILILPGQVVSAITVFHEHGLHIISRMIGKEIRKFEEIELGEEIEIRHNMDSTFLFENKGGKAHPLRWGVGLYSELYKAYWFGVLKRGRKYERGEKILLQRLL